MDAKEKIMGAIISAMSGDLTAEQLTKLQNVIVISLHEYSVEPEKYEIQKYDDYDQFLCEQYYSALKVEGKREKTIERYLSQIKLMLSRVQKPIKEISTEDLRFYLAKYQAERKVSNTTLDGMRKCLCAFFSWLEYSDYIDKSPARRIKQIKHDTVPERELNPAELERAMICSSSVREKAIISFMYDTAARVSEVAGITLEDIDFSENTVRLHGKGGKDRVSLFTEKSAMYLKEYLQERKYQGIELFCSRRRPYVPVTKASLEAMVRSIGKRAGIDHLHPHRFRVTRITNLVNRGMPLQDVQELAGHSSINTTRLYYRNNLENVKYSYRKAI